MANVMEHDSRASQVQHKQTALEPLDAMTPHRLDVEDVPVEVSDPCEAAEEFYRRTRPSTSGLDPEGEGRKLH